FVVLYTQPSRAVTSVAVPATCTLSLHDALPISERLKAERNKASEEIARRKKSGQDAAGLITEMKRVSEEIKQYDERIAQLDERTDRKSTRLNSSLQIISYAVLC